MCNLSYCIVIHNNLFLINQIVGFVTILNIKDKTLFKIKTTKMKEKKHISLVLFLIEDRLVESKYMKTALVCGAGGFIGSHLVKKLKQEGFWVRGADLKFPEYSLTQAYDFIKKDLRNPFLW